MKPRSMLARRGVLAGAGVPVLAGSAIRKSESLRPEGSRDAQAGTVDGVVQWHLPLGGASGISLDLGGAARFSSEEVIPDYDRYPLGGTATLRGVWASAVNDVYIVGDSSTIAHHNGTAWTMQVPPVSATLRGVWSTAGGRVFVVGEDSTGKGIILHRDP